LHRLWTANNAVLVKGKERKSKRRGIFGAADAVGRIILSITMMNFLETKKPEVNIKSSGFSVELKKFSKGFVWDKGPTWRAVHVAGGGGGEGGVEGEGEGGRRERDSYLTIDFTSTLGTAYPMLMPFWGHDTVLPSGANTIK
jgi:hypothetical protein